MICMIHSSSEIKNSNDSVDITQKYSKIIFFSRELPIFFTTFFCSCLFQFTVSQKKICTLWITVHVVASTTDNRKKLQKNHISSELAFFNYLSDFSFSVFNFMTCIF